jgi:hypothetical protein
MCSSTGTCGSGGSGGGVASCPSGYPIDCGNGFCCPSGLPLCCPGALCTNGPDCSGAPMNLAPSITNMPPALSFDESHQERQLPIDYTDPNGCRPSFIFTPCRGFLSCGPTSVGTHARRDGRLAGSVILTLGVTYAPADQSDTIDLQVTPMSTPGWADPIDLIQSGVTPQPGGSPITGDQAVPIGGAGVTVSVTDTRPAPNPGGGPGGGTTCSAYASGCTVCSIQACVTVGGAGCASAGYRTSDGGFYAVRPIH